MNIQSPKGAQLLDISLQEMDAHFLAVFMLVSVDYLRSTIIMQFSMLPNQIAFQTVE